MREIGSEFWTKHNIVQQRDVGNEVCLLSGRTALSFVIDDICRAHDFRKVLLPSYCCESMIQPFVSREIEVQFYDVDVYHAKYPYENDADAVLLIDFFGYSNPQNEVIARFEKQAGKIVIYDGTHKLDGNPEVEAYADYSFCSYRKWFYCNFAKAIKHCGVFDSAELRTNDRYVAIRNLAAEKKEKYISGFTAEKEDFLKLFSKAEEMLDEDYSGYSGAPVAYDVNEIAEKRRENAGYLIGELKIIPEIGLWRDSVRPNDVPLFVPILVDPLIRNDLRRVLINEKIYCPIHWPASSYHGDCNEVYDMELSLICDQRYGLEDMARMVDVIKGYFNI